MPFEAITIRQAVQNVLDNKYVLPSIQREFIWSTEQIEVLFDSILRGYPLGSFLFWYVPEEDVNTWQVYKFLTSYSEFDLHRNPRAVIGEGRDVTAVLDGQQRLTSLVIGLAGSYAYRLPNKRRLSAASYPKRELHIDLMRPADESDGDKRYAIRFLTAEEVASDDTRWWIPMPEVFRRMRRLPDVLAFMADQRVASAPLANREFAADTLARFCECLNTESSITFLWSEKPI